MNKIPPIFFNPNAPSLYGLGLTDYEILTKIAYKVNECVEGVNSFSDLYKEIKEDVENLNKRIQTEVKKELKQMLDDGTIQEIINDFIQRNGLAKSDSLTTVRRWRKMNATGINDYLNKSELYAFNQGATVFKNEDGATRFVIAFSKHTRQASGVENSRIAVFKPSSLIPEYYKDLPVGHAQSIAERNGFLYIAHSSENAGTASTKITRVRASTLAHSTSDDKPFTGHQPYQVFTDNDNNLYFYDLKDNGIYKITDFTNANADFLYSINPKGTVNGMCINRQGFLLYADSEQIKALDFKDGSLVWSYNIKNISNDGFNVGEIQALSVYSGNQIAVFSWVPVGGTSGIAQRNLTQMFLINPVLNNLDTELTTIEKSGTNHATLYVAGDTTTSFSEPTTHGTVNPNGGSTESPFNTIQEALDYFANTHAKSVEIRMIGPSSDRTYSIWSGVNGFLRNWNAGVSLVCGGLYVENGGSCRIGGASESERLTFVQTNNSAVGSFSAGIAPLDALGGTIQLVSHVRSNGNSNDYHKCQWSLHTNQSILLSSAPSTQDITLFAGTSGDKIYLGNSLSNRTTRDF